LTCNRAVVGAIQVGPTAIARKTIGARSPIWRKCCRAIRSRGGPLSAGDGLRCAGRSEEGRAALEATGRSQILRRIR
jgi:hypothetical protein